MGGSYELGANIGSIVGGAIGGAVYGKISATKSPNKACGTECFVAGTLIETQYGQKPIEEIQAGDIVLAENPETGEIALKKVVQTFENESDELVHVFVNGEEIITTPEHPFYVPKFGWTSAIKLRAGDILVLSNGEYVVVEAVQHEILESPVKVYNFEVEEFHTYFVGESGVLVHNDCTTKPYDIVEYGDKTPGLENHHGVMDKWASENIPGYKPRMADSPSMALTKAQHNATRSVYAKWKIENYGFRGSVDWQNISARDIFYLSESMFDAAKVPQYARNNYYSAFNKYIYNLIQ